MKGAGTMTDQELNRKLKGAFTRATPDVLDAVRSQCETQKGTVIPMKQPNKKNRVLRFGVIAAALALVIGLGAGIGSWQANRAVASTVSLDVNPSIEIRVNRHEQVLDVIPLNEDAKIVIGDMDFSRSDLDVTVNALIGSMLRNGYLNELANSILISVDDDNAERGKQLEERLALEIDALLRTGTFTGSVLSQTLSTDDALQTLADQYGVTAGKAKLIQQIVTQDSRYTFEDLAALSINELNLISESGSLHLDEVNATGTASDKAYIGRDGAKAAALAYTNVAEADVLAWECELDFEDGYIVYELEFHTSAGEYDCHVNALTGEVIKSHHEKTEYSNNHHGSTSTDPGTTPSSDGSVPSVTYLTAEQAKAAALTHAGVNSVDAFNWECEFDKDDGRAIYEIEFCAGTYEYSYDIDATDGSVIKYEREYNDDRMSASSPSTQPTPDPTPTSSTQPAASTSVIGTDAAKAAALAHAGVSAANAYGWECELDHDDGRTVYEIEFKAGRYEYSYEIEAYTGTVLDHEKEYDD